MRIKTKVNACSPLLPGFWWTNAKGEEKCDSIKFERLSDFCYGCGKLGHTSQFYHSEIVMSEINTNSPMSGPWLTGVRPRRSVAWHQLGGGNVNQLKKRDNNRTSWGDLVRGGHKAQEGMGPSIKHEQLKETVISGTLR